MAAKKPLSKITRWDYANDADEPEAWLVIQGEPTLEAVKAGKSTILGQYETEEEADAVLAEG